MECTMSPPSQTSSLGRECDRLWSKLIARIWGGRCGICRSASCLSAHHLIKRRHFLYRHCPQNGILLCFNHHHMAETRQAEFVKLLEKKHPATARWVTINSAQSLKPTSKNRQELSARRSLLASLLSSPPSLAFLYGGPPDDRRAHTDHSLLDPAGVRSLPDP